MNRCILFVLLLGGLGFGRVSAQSVTVDAKIDSLQILIGEQAKITLEASFDANKRAVFPHFTDTIVKGVEIVDIAKPDTQFLNGKQRLLITQEYTITSFDSALYYLPPLEVLVDNQPYRSKALALKVYSMPVDTTQVDQFFGQKEVMKAPFLWEDWQWCFYWGILCFPCAFLIYYFIKRLRDNKPIIRRVKVTPKLPPHQQALLEIERIKSERIWQKGQAKEYYTELTDAIRTYIKERFDFNALEMTSAEIVEHLMNVQDKNAIQELKSLFLTADLVKFAKHNPEMNENDANLVSAMDFVNETKVAEDENKKPEPTEITIVEKQTLRTKIIIVCCIVALSLTIIASLVYIGSEIYNVFA